MEVDDEDDNERFTVEQIQKYVRYARTIKPKISEESKTWFVRYYRQLRQRDQSESKAYRFTVRQLESLIRLSEALARLHCDNVVSPKYVKEAARLLKKSIISVDSEDIPLFDFEQQAEAEEKEEKKEGDEEQQDEDEAAEKPMTIGYDEYMKIANLVVYYIRRKEIEPEAGIKQGDVINEVMKELGDELEGDEDLELKNKIIGFVISRLIEVDHIILVKEDNEENKMERILIVHPNYDPDSRNTANLRVDPNKESKFEHDRRDRIHRRQSPKRRTSRR